MTNQPNTPITNPETITNPQERNAWIFGFNPQAEIWNGRLAMLGFLVAILIELFSGQGLLHFWGLL
ncbi:MULTISPECIES: chlorophyll a/b-binding protein [unclassified Coleofasciculus]|uniref:chlorophyll a/b-binding protein n=1 Tax=unclassified Coleofasciculus TaxID=2692782 RepID=UPI0018822B99|nr:MULTISPECIES: chlorophyll a/b-binding protein [unclassified Coleofasciculus]MBE9125412.1 high light inducible protein [Coleofasciculus sp. LEGE 07081]MBE9147371.1 high light inducible protein [Coleofasciculus sp. LEGE 07092]